MLDDAFGWNAGDEDDDAGEDNVTGRTRPTGSGTCGAVSGAVRRVGT